MNWRSYRPKTANSKSSRTPFFKRNEKEFKFPWYGKLALAFALIGVTVYLLFLSPLFALKEVEIQGTEETLPEQTELSAYFQSHLGENLFLFDKDTYTEELMAMFPYLERVTIDRDFPNRLIVSVESSPNVANVEITKTDGTQIVFIVNSQGYVTAVGTPDETLPKIIMDVTGTDLLLTEEVALMIKKELIPEDKLELILTAEEGFEAKFDMQVVWTVYLKRAREIHLYTERDFYVWIDLSQDIEAQLDKLKFAGTELNIYESNLEYIDLRIFGGNGEKVIYKLK